MIQCVDTTSQQNITSLQLPYFIVHGLLVDHVLTVTQII